MSIQELDYASMHTRYKRQLILKRDIDNPSGESPTKCFLNVLDIQKKDISKAQIQVCSHQVAVLWQRGNDSDCTDDTTGNIL